MAKVGKKTIIRYSYSVLENLVTTLNKHLKDTKEGMDKNSADTILANLWHMDDLSTRIKNLCEIIKYLHQ